MVIAAVAFCRYLMEKKACSKQYYNVKEASLAHQASIWPQMINCTLSTTSLIGCRYTTCRVRLPDNQPLSLTTKVYKFYVTLERFHIKISLLSCAENTHGPCHVPNLIQEIFPNILLFAA